MIGDIDIARVGGGIEQIRGHDVFALILIVIIKVLILGFRHGLMALWRLGSSDQPLIDLIVIGIPQIVYGTRVDFIAGEIAGDNRLGLNRFQVKAFADLSVQHAGEIILEIDLVDEGEGILAGYIENHIAAVFYVAVPIGIVYGGIIVFAGSGLAQHEREGAFAGNNALAR